MSMYNALALDSAEILETVNYVLLTLTSSN